MAEEGHISLETRPEVMWAPPVPLDYSAIANFQARQHYIQGAQTDDIAIITMREPAAPITGTLTYSGDAVAYQDYVPGSKTFSVAAVDGSAGYSGEYLLSFKALDPPYHRRHREVFIDIRAPLDDDSAYVGGFCRYVVMLEATKLPPFFCRSGFVEYDADGVQQLPPTTTPPAPAIDRDGSYVDLYFHVSDDYTTHHDDAGEPTEDPGTLPTPQPTGTTAAYSMEDIVVPIRLRFGHETNSVEGTDFEVVSPDGTVQTPGETTVTIPAGERSSYIRIRSLDATGNRQYIRPTAYFNNYGLQVQELPFSHMGPPGAAGRKTHEYDARYDKALDGTDSDWWSGCHNFNSNTNPVAHSTLSLLVTDDETGETNPDGTTARRFAVNPAAVIKGCMLRQFLGSQIGAWENITEANLSTDIDKVYNHLSLYVKKGTSETFALQIQDRTKQGAGDPTAYNDAFFGWTTGGRPYVISTKNLGPHGGASIEINGESVPSGWYRAIMWFPTLDEENGDVTQYILRPSTSDVGGTGQEVTDGPYTYFWGVQWERNGTSGPSGFSRYQPWDHNQWHPRENCRAASTVMSTYIQLNNRNA